MANIRAGVAYIDVRLGAIDDFKNKLKDEVERAGAGAGKTLGETIKKNVPAKAGQEVGQKLNKELTKAFFQDAKSDFTAGFRALANRDLGTAKALFQSAGKNFATSLRGGFSNGINSIFNGFDKLASVASTVGSKIGSAAQAGWTKFQELGVVLDKASQKMGFLSFQIQNFGLIATTVFTAPIAAATAFATVIGVQTAAKLEQATNALKFLLPPGYKVEALLQRLKKTAIESPIFDTTDLIFFTQKFTAAGVEISKTERFLKAFSNIALVTGASTDEANRAITAITQVFGKGKLQAEELNQQLGEAMPSVLKLLRDQLGVTQAELTKLVKEGKISGDDLIAAFTKIGESKKFLQGAAEGATTLNGVFQELQETVQTQLGEFFLKNSKQIKEGLKSLQGSLTTLISLAGPIFIKLIGYFKTFTDDLAKAIQWYQRLDPSQQQFLQTLVKILAVIGPLTIALGGLLGAFAGIAAGVAAIATPAGAVIAAIAAIGIAIFAAIKWFKSLGEEGNVAGEKLKAFWNGFFELVIRPIVNGLKELWANVVTAFNQIKNALGGNVGSWKSWGGFLKELLTGVWAVIKALSGLVGDLLGTILSVLGSVIKAIASFISGVIKLLKGLTDFLVGVFTGDWSRALEGIKEIWNGLWDIIIGVLYNVGEAIWKLVKGIVTGIINFFKNLFDVLVGHSIVPDMVKLIIAWFQKLVAPIRAVLNAITGAFRAFAGVLKQFANYFITGVRTVASTVAQLPGKIVSALSGLASRLYNAGTQAMQGFVNGLSSIGQRAINKARDIANSVVDIVGNVLDIGSPSKVFRKYGRFVVQGFILGMGDLQPNLTASLQAFGNLPTFDPVNGSPSAPLLDNSQANGSAGLNIQNYYANDNVDPWRQAEDWWFIVTSRGGVA